MIGNSTTGVRRILLLLACSCFVAAICWAASPLFSGNAYGDERLAPIGLLPISWLAAIQGSDSTSYATQLALFLGTLLLTQWMFLRPRSGFRIRMAEPARPLKTAVLAAAFMAMMMTFGTFAVLAEILDFWHDVAGDESWQILIAVNLVLWLGWAIVFHFHWRNGTRFQQLERMARALVVGSVLELIVAAGVFVWKTDEEDCYCLRGSYVGLVFSATVMIWAFGPGLLLLFLREARYERKLPHS